MKNYQAVVEGFCRAAGIPLPITEYKFHPIRKWRFDFAWPGFENVTEDRMCYHRVLHDPVALEIEGGVYVQGRHSRGKGFESDCEKYSTAAVMGWKVLRVSTGQLQKGVCWPWLESLFKKGKVKHGG